MEQTTDSTVSYTQAEYPGDRQDVIAQYVDRIIRRITERPYDSVPQLFQHVALDGPCQNPADVLRLFGGRIIFCHTCRRMSIIRKAVLNNETDAMPVELRMRTERGQPGLDPPFTDYRHFWCPHLDSPRLYWYEVEGMREEIYRYPAVLNTDSFFDETEEDSCQTSGGTDDDVECSEWFQPMGPIGAEYLWGPPPDSRRTDTDEEENDERSGSVNGRQLSQINMNEEVNQDESDNEDWSHPPPVNTMGLEWFYE